MYITLNTEEMADLKRAVIAYRDSHATTEAEEHHYGDLLARLILHEEMPQEDPIELLSNMYSVLELEAFETGPTHFKPRLSGMGDVIGEYLIKNGVNSVNYFKDKTEHPPWMEEVRFALKRNRKIAAIKIYRDQTGEGLRESKFFVDNLHQQMKDSGEISSSILDNLPIR